MVKNLSISKLDNSNIPKYETFLAECPHALFYHSVRYKDFIKELLGCDDCYLIAEEEGEIKAAFPIMTKRFSRGQLLNSLPYFGSHGSILYKGATAASSLVQEYNQMIKKEDVISSTVITNPFAEIAEFPFLHHYTDFRIGQFTPLPSGKSQAEIRNQLLSLFESSTRRNINKAMEAQIEVQVDLTALQTLERLHRENIEGKGGLCKSSNFFDLLLKYFRAEKDFKVFTARLDGVVIAALLLFYYKNTVEYFTPAINDSYRNLQPLALIIYEAMVDAASLGLTTWNWGGTWATQEGVYRFKKKWGSLSRNYQYYTQLNCKELLNMGRADLLAEFPNFYVLPFAVLNSEVKV